MKFLGGLLHLIIVNLPLIVLIVVIVSVKSKREEASKHPKNAAQRELADDVIAAIERAAPDLEKATITYESPVRYTGGGVHFKSQRGYLFEYDYLSHGYSNVSYAAAGLVANKIAEHFGRGRGEVRNHHDGDYFEVWIQKEESRTIYYNM